eukprot:969394_1
MLGSTSLPIGSIAGGSGGASRCSVSVSSPTVQRDLESTSPCDAKDVDLKVNIPFGGVFTPICILSVTPLGMLSPVLAGVIGICPNSSISSVFTAWNLAGPAHVLVVLGGTCDMDPTARLCLFIHNEHVERCIICAKHFLFLMKLMVYTPDDKHHNKGNK